MPFSLADPSELRAHADRMNRHAEATRGVGESLRRILASTFWQGPAARSFGDQVDGTLHDIGRGAGLVDEAAAALRRLADAWETLLADLRRALRDGQRLVGDSVELLSDLLDEPGALLGDAGTLAGDVVDTAGDLISGAGDLIGI